MTTPQQDLRALSEYDTMSEKQQEAFDRAVERLINQAANAQQILDQNKLYALANKIERTDREYGRYVTPVVRMCAGKVGINDG